MEHDKLAIIIPAYNEENTIVEVIKGLIKHGEVIVIDDCSIDDTNKLATQTGAKVFKNSKNLGYEGSLGVGFEKAFNLKAKYVITFDADGQHDPEMIPTFYDHMKKDGYDLVLGVRPNKARISEKVMGLYFYIRFGVKDILCGMKGYNIDLWKSNNMKFSSFESIGTELAMRAILKGIKMAQIEIPIHERIDKPRFGNIVKANYKIFKSLINVLRLNF